MTLALLSGSTLYGPVGSPAVPWQEHVYVYSHVLQLVAIDSTWSPGGGP